MEDPPADIRSVVVNTKARQHRDRVR